MYKLGALNTQSDALSCLHTKVENTHDDWDEIATLLINEVHSCDQTCDNDQLPDNDDIIDLPDINADHLFVTIHQQQRSDPTFTSITHKELVVAQLSDPFCIDIRRKLNGAGGSTLWFF